MFGNSALSAADVAAVTDGNRNSGWGGDVNYYLSNSVNHLSHS